MGADRMGSMDLGKTYHIGPNQRVIDMSEDVPPLIDENRDEMLQRMAKEFDGRYGCEKLLEILKEGDAMIPSVFTVRVTDGEPSPRFKVHDNLRVVQIDKDGTVWLARLGNSAPSTDKRPRKGHVTRTETADENGVWPKYERPA